MRVSRAKAKRRWRAYATPAGTRPVLAFIDALPLDNQIVIEAAMKDVRVNGTTAARHLGGDIYEVRAFAKHRGYRILFAEEGRRSQVPLSLHAIKKQTQPTPHAAIDLAEKRLASWRQRAQRR